MNPAGFAEALSHFKTVDVRLSARQKRREQAYFSKVRNAEVSYGAQLRKIARHVGDIIKIFDPNDSASVAEIQRILEQYGDILKPWARAAAQRMLAEVSRRDETAWRKSSQEIGINLRDEIQNTPLGEIYRRILDEQVHLITSLPVDAGRRVQSLAQDYLAGSKRYDEMVSMIMNSGNVTISRANLIARTETAKASSALVQARSEYIGSEGYIWRTSLDPFVRKAHKRLEGKFFSWNSPPIAEENGERHHPGMFPNCRCFAEPIIPEIIT